MALYERLTGEGRPKLPVHQFAAAVAEKARGKLTRADIGAAFSLSEAELVEFDALEARMLIDTALSSGALHDVLLLAETGLMTAAQVRTRIGIVVI